MFNALLYKKYPQLFRQRIQVQPAWNYYVIIIAFITALIALICKLWWLAISAAVIYLLLTLMFIIKRLSLHHIEF
jgi:uncharacterized membrane protein